MAVQDLGITTLGWGWGEPMETALCVLGIPMVLTAGSQSHLRMCMSVT